jgi:hypothetical protein
MPIATKYLFFASMDVEPDKEALFNEVYDDEHVPNLLKVPGVVSVKRIKAESFAITIGGERRSVAVGGEPAYTAIYEIESPDVLVSKEWAAAVEAGRWPGEVRPYTTNRRHTLQKVIGPFGRNSNR